MRISRRDTRPSWGLDYYCSYLRATREVIPLTRTVAMLIARSKRILEQIFNWCDHLEAQCGHMGEWSEPLPRIFVHGGCLVKNVLVRTTASRLTFAPIDWAGAGWSFPATDLGQRELPYCNVPQSDSDCETYDQILQEQWPDFDVDAVRPLAYLGQIFWSLKAISLSLPGFENERTHLDTLTDRFAICADVSANAIRARLWRN